MKKVVVILVGIVLLAGVIFTGTYGVSQKNIEVYERAMEMQSIADTIGWADFRIADYPIAVYDGENEYVFTRNKRGYDVNKRAVTMNFLVATAYPVDDHFEVITPSVEQMSSFIGLASAGATEYGIVEHSVTLWHEAFHCYQLTNYMEVIKNICPEGIEENTITLHADTNKGAVDLFKRQAEILEAAVKSEDIDRIRAYIVEYKKLEEERNALLDEKIIHTEEYYERVEGGAYYVEALMHGEMNPEKFQNDYIGGISEFSNGSSKYYRTGMAQYMIMDVLNPGWKANYDFSEPVMELIYEELEI